MAIVGLAGTAAQTAHAQVRIEYKPSPTRPEVRDALKGDDLSRFAAYVNAVIKLPRELPVYFQDCGTENASYGPALGEDNQDHAGDPIDDTPVVTFCYELAGEIAKSMVGLYPDEPKKQNQAFYEGLVYVLSHELGHAFIDILDLPAAGNEEDAVDQLATFLMVEVGFPKAAIHGALAFYLMFRTEKDDAWDEHAPTLRRFASITCWSYGSKPRDDFMDTFYDESSRHLTADEEGLAEAAAARRKPRCPGEWQKIHRAWERLLAPHRKRQPVRAGKR